MSNYFYKEWQIMLGLHLVLVTLPEQFTISIEQVELVNLNTIFSAHQYGKA